jgi:hypothetical protein
MSHYRDGCPLKVENVPVSGELERVESVRYMGGSTEKADASHLGRPGDRTAFTVVQRSSPLSTGDFKARLGGTPLKGTQNYRLGFGFSQDSQYLRKVNSKCPQ